MYTPQNGIFGNFLQSWQFSLDPRIPTIGDLMREQGYTTAYYGKWHLSMAGVSATEGPPTTLQNNYLGPYGFDYSEVSTSLEPVGYNDGVYNDPVWTKQGVDWLHDHGGSEQPWFLVVSLLNPHDIAYFPRGFTADVTRPDWQVELPLNFEDDPATKPTVHSQYANGAALIRGGIGHRRHGDVEAADEHLLRPDRQHRRQPRRGRQGAARLGRDGQHGDHPHRRPRRDGRLAPRRRQGPDDLRRAAADAAVDLLPRALRSQGVRTPALAEAVDILPTCLELAGRRGPGLALPVAARPVARAGARGPGRRPGQGLHRQHL